MNKKFHAIEFTLHMKITFSTAIIQLILHRAFNKNIFILPITSLICIFLMKIFYKFSSNISQSIVSFVFDILYVNYLVTVSNYFFNFAFNFYYMLLISLFYEIYELFK